MPRLFRLMMLVIPDLHLMQNAIELDVPCWPSAAASRASIAMGGGLIQDVPTYLGQQVEAGKISKDRVTEIEDCGIQLGR